MDDVNETAIGLDAVHGAEVGHALKRHSRLE
jgi:hypothetical protein